MLEIIDAVAAWIVPAALRASIDGALFAAPAWLICRLAPSLPATLRTWLWWCVSLKLVLAALAVPGLAIEVLPASWAAALPSSHGSATGRGVDQPALAARMDQAVTATAPDHATREGSGSRQLSPPAASTLATVPVAEASSNAGLLESRWMPVGRILAIGWLGGIVIHLSLLLRHAWRCRSVVARAVAPAPELAAEHREIALRLGLTRVPRLLESSEVTVPQAVGALRPVVLVPSGTATRLSRRERAMVLCHELTHVRRADLALGWVPALAERVLVWHPVAWWAAREYALARESACDHAVLRALDTEAHDYGRLLVKLGVGRSVAGVAAAGASPSFHLLRRRLSMLQHFSPRASRTSSLSLLAVTLVVFLIPLRVVAERSVTVDWSGPRPIETATGDVPEADVSSASSPPAADRQGESKRAAARRDSRRLTAWIYVVDDHNVSMNGDSWDIETAKRARSSGAGPIFFFRRDGQGLVIDDPQMLQTIDAILAPMSELGRQQGELGEKQGALGRQQGQLGEKQGALGARQGELGAKQGELSMQMTTATADILTAAAERMRRRGTDEDVRREQDAKARMQEFERQVRELGERQAALGEEQEALGREQEKLGVEQRKLGEEQARLGELQQEASERAERQLRELVDRAMAEGLARPIN